MPYILTIVASLARMKELFGAITYHIDGVFTGWQIPFNNNRHIMIASTYSNASEEEEKYVLATENIPVEEIAELFNEDDDVTFIEVDDEFYDHFKDWFLTFVIDNFSILREFATEEKRKFDAEEKRKFDAEEKRQLTVDTLTSPRSQKASPSRELLKSLKQSLILAVESIDNPDSIDAILDCTKLLSVYVQE